MKKKISLGNDIFDQFMEDKGYYVDKTELIYELAADNKNKVTLFTRPRRFGKSLIMSMLASFFDIKNAGSKVFDDLNIMKNHPEFCKEWMHQYPTLLISFKDVEGLTFEDAYAKLKAIISDLCKKYIDLISKNNINPVDIEIFDRLMFKTAEKEEIQNTLKIFMRMMHAVYGKPVILLIDEYDVPLAKAHSNGYYREMLDVIRGIMSISLKSNEYLKFAVVTGCLRISKESIFTGVNNFSCYSVTNKRFSQYFGFTEAEVIEMLKYFGVEDKLDLVKKWYDGYLFGDTEVYCPWDVANYISDVTYDKDAEPKNYWANTSGNDILDDFVNHPQIDASEKFEVLLNGGIIQENICEELTYDRITASESNLWSILLMTGYVTKAIAPTVKNKINIKIPNLEVADLFQSAVVERFERTLDSSEVKAFINALWDKDEQTASEKLSDILWNSISFFDYSESYYHGMLTGIFASQNYQLDSNIESGLGRLDLRILDKKNKRILLLEFKRSSNEENLDKDCDEAIFQVFKNCYNKNVLFGYKQQLVYGIAFFKKSAKIKLMK